MQDIVSNIHPVPVINPAAAVTDNTPLVGRIIDRRGFDALAFVIQTGTLADADATFAVLVEHGDTANLADASPVSDAELQGSEAEAGFTAADDNAARKIGYRGSRRFVRVTVTPTGNTGNAFITALAILAAPRLAPTANPPA